MPAKPTEINGIRIECSYSELRDVMELKVHPDNNNSHPEEQIKLLARLYEIHGIRTPITVSDLSGRIVR